MIGDLRAPRGATNRATWTVAAILAALFLFGGSATAAVETITADRGATIEALAGPLSADVGPGGLLCVTSWITEGERRDLPALLAAYGSRGVRVGFEMAGSAHNRPLLSMIDAFGGAALERTTDEAPGATSAVAEALLDPSAADLLFDAVRVPKNGNVPVEVHVPAGAADLIVVASVDRPEGRAALKGPTGGEVAPTLSTSSTRFWRVTAPAAGVWTVTVSGEGRYRLRARASGVPPVGVEIPAHAQVGDVAVTVRLADAAPASDAAVSTVVVRLFGQGNDGSFGPVSQTVLAEAGPGRYEGTIAVPSDGVYAVEAVAASADGAQRVARRGFVAGASTPIGFAQRPGARRATLATPEATVSSTTEAAAASPTTETSRLAPASTTEAASAEAAPSEVGVTVLEVGPAEAAAAPTLYLDGAPVTAEASPVQEAAEWRIQEVAGSISGVAEGVHEAELRVGDAVDTWLFAVDGPTATRLLITEVVPKDDWIEIEALADGDYAGVIITDLDDADREPLATSPVTLKAGDRFVVHFGDGVDETDEAGDVDGNGIRDLYTPGRLGRTDQAVLVERGTGPGGPIEAVLDAVGWTDGVANEDEAKDFPRLVRANEWTGDPVRSAFEAGFVRRVTSDANAAADWAPSYRPTPGRLADDPLQGKQPTPGMIRIEEVGLWDAGTAGGAPWAELLVAVGPIDVSVFALTDLDGDAAPLAARPFVLPAGTRIVVHWAFGEDEVGPDGWGDADGNGAVDLYAVGEEPPSRNDDELVVTLGGVAIDAVAWGEVTKLADTAPLAACGWPATARLDTPAAHATLVRTAEAVRPVSWKVSLTPTPGKPNVVPTAPAAGSVKIVALDPTGDGGDWAEIRASAAVDVSRFVLTDMDGDDLPLAEAPVTLRQGERARVHWGEGTDETDEVGDANGNGIRDLYLEKDGDLSSTDDQLVLKWGETVHDAVVWTNGDGSMAREEQKDLKALVDAGYWRVTLGADFQKAAVPVGLYRLPIARTDPANDADGPGDWASVRPEGAQ